MTTTTAPATCGHGLSADLCAGPGHYPADDRAAAPMTDAAESSFQHRHFGTCSFDCAACDPYLDEPLELELTAAELAADAIARAETAAYFAAREIASASCSF